MKEAARDPVDAAHDPAPGPAGARVPPLLSPFGELSAHLRRLTRVS